MELESVQADREHEKKKNMALEVMVKTLEEQLKVGRPFLMRLINN